VIGFAAGWLYCWYRRYNWLCGWLIADKVAGYLGAWLARILMWLACGWMPMWLAAYVAIVGWLGGQVWGCLYG